MRESVVFYRSFAEAIKALPKEEQLKALWAVINYGLDGVIGLSTLFQTNFFRLFFRYCTGV